MADSPQILTPEQFRRKYGYSAPTQPQTPITLTPEQFTARYGNVLGKPSPTVTGKMGRIKSAEDLAAGFTRPQADAPAPTNIPPSPFIQEIIDRTGVTKTLPEEDSAGEPFLRGTKNAIGALGEATQILPSILNLQPKFLRPPQHERVVSEIEAETKKASDDVKSWAEKNIQARPATGKYARPAENFLDYLDPVRMYQTVGENAPLMAAFAGATIAHPAAGAALMFAVEGGSANEAMLEYEKKTGKKIPPIYRENIPVIIGAVNAALEKTGLDEIFKVGKSAGLKRKLVKAALATIIEGGTEGAQEVTNILAETGYGGQIPADAGQRLVESIYAGLLLGAGGSTISALAGQPDKPRAAPSASTPQAAIPSQPQLATAAPETPMREPQSGVQPAPTPAAQFQQPSVEIEDQIRKTTEALRAAQEGGAAAPELSTAQEPVKEKKTTPDRTLQIGRGMNGNVRVVFPDKAHADLYALIGRFRRRVHYGKNPPKGLTAGVEDADRLAKKFGVTREEIFKKSDEYREQIRGNIKGLQQGDDYTAPSVSFDKPAAETSTPPIERVSPPVPVSGQAKPEIASPVAGSEAAQAEKQVSAEVKYVPLSQLHVDPDRFQNRATPFSEKTAATIAERFDPNKLDALTVWHDPKDNKDYVISGHSRFEGLGRRKEPGAPIRYFQGDEQAAINFAKLEANRLGTPESLSESIKAYRTAKAQNLSRAKLKDLFDGDLDFLDAAQNLDQKGDFVNILNQPAAAEFPYIKRFSRWVGELRGKYADKLTDRHEQQIFDWLYKGEKKNVDTGKDAFFNKVETQIERLDFSPEQPLVLKRGEVAQIGTRGRADTAALERELDQLREDRRKARTTQEAETIDKEIARISKGIAEIVKTQPDLFSASEEAPVVSTQPKTAPVTTTPENPIAPRENILQQAARKITQRGEVTAKEYDRAVNIFDLVIAKQKGKPIAEQQQAVRAELESAGVNPVIVEELTNPQRAARPFDEETGARRDLTSREGRIKRAVEPPAQLKSKVDAIANAGKAMADAEASLEQAKGDIINEIESRGGEVVVNTDTGAFTIKLNVGKAKMGLPDMIALGNLRQEAANAGAYSLATVGRGFEIAATPERIAKAEPLLGTFGDKVKEFIRRSQAAKSAQKDFAAAKKTAQGDLVDFYLAERAAGREPRSLKAVAADGTAVEVLTRRQRSSAEPDTPITGRDFAAEIAQRKAEAKKRSDTIGPRGEPFLSTRKAGESAIEKAKQSGSYVAEPRSEDLPPSARDQDKAIAALRKPYEPNYDKRPDASAKTDQLAKEAVESIGVNRRHGRVLLANAISAEAREKGAVNLIGKEVRTSDDVAALAQVYRDPRWETLRYIFVKDGKIVFVTGVSSRLPASTRTFPVNEKSSVEWLQDLMFASEADGYYMLHNHPSGEVKPSRADIEETKKISDAVDGFKGHVIIDSNKYTQIARLDGKIESAVHEKNFGEERLLKPSIFNPVLGTRLSSAEVVAKIGQKYKAPNGWVTLISSGASGVRGMMEVESAVMQSPKRSAATIRRFARQTGASDVFLVSEQSFWDKHKRELTIAVKDGFLRDAVSTRGYSIQEETMIRPSGKEFGISERRGREVRDGGNVLQEAAQKVAKKGENPQIYTLEFKKWFGDWENDPANASKVVDKDGKPLVVYHGTGATGLNPLSLNKSQKTALEIIKSQGDNAANYADTLLDEGKITKMERAAVDELLSTMDNLTGFDVFQIGKSNRQKEKSPAIYFTTSPEYAERYAGSVATSSNAPSIYPGYLNIKNLFDPSNQNHVNQILSEKSFSAAVRKDQELERYAKKWLARGHYSTIEDARVINAIKRLGFDGYMTKEEGFENYAVFEPTQIKSAIGNRGTFSPTEPSIVRENESGYSAKKQPWEMTRDELIKSQIAYNERKIEEAKAKLSEISKAAPRIEGNLTRQKDQGDLRTASAFTQKFFASDKLYSDEIKRRTEAIRMVTTDEGKSKMYDFHRKEVEKALREGKPVPEKVLAEYRNSEKEARLKRLLPPENMSAQSGGIFSGKKEKSKNPFVREPAGGFTEADRIPSSQSNEARAKKIEKAKSEGRYFGDSITKTSEPQARYDSSIGSSDKAGLMTEQEANQKYQMRECE